jgi:type IV pilus assembly protein PilB
MLQGVRNGAGAADEQTAHPYPTLLKVEPVTAVKYPDTLQALITLGTITADEADQAFAQSQETGGVEVLQWLHTSGRVSATDVVRANCLAAGIDFFDLVEYPVDSAATTLITGDFAKKNTVLPLRFDDGKVIVAVTHKRAGDLLLRDDLQRMTRAQVVFAVAMKDDLVNKINKTYRAEGELAELAAGLADDNAADMDDLSALTEAAGEDGPVVRFVNLIITQAIDDGASDIHIEPGEKELTVRYRIDGVLKEQSRQPRATLAALISRLKIMSEMNIAEKRVPQDGRLSVLHKGKKIDLRVAALPTVHGFEKIVMRILDNSTAQMSLDDLGFSPENFVRFQESYRKPYGMILVTGPTGSGKSTTLYATVNIVSNPQVNVITVEDPVEYRIPGINQVQVNTKAGMTFAAALRSILRADPDIVLIGEIRDETTATIAVEAALTGHLVLSTLHTNDAPSAVTRLTEMGIEPFLVGSALDSVLAQRLCRRLCKKCKIEYTAEPDELTALRQFPWKEGEPLPTLFKAKENGCNFCSNTGYKGRLALHEVMTVTEEIERLAVARASSEDIMRLAMAQGMTTLRQDGWYKVGLGITSIREILRVVV